MRTALSLPPQTQPVSSASRSGQSRGPASTSGRRRRACLRCAGRRCRTRAGSRAAQRRRLPIFSSSRPAGVQKRMRVSTLMTKRQRSAPAGLRPMPRVRLPYICCSICGRSMPRSRASISAARPALPAASHFRRHHAGMHQQPAGLRCAIGAGAASRSIRRASANPDVVSVSSLRGLRTPCATASRCRSWLPSRRVTASPSARRRRSAPSESGRG